MIRVLRDHELAAQLGQTARASGETLRVENRRVTVRNDSSEKLWASRLLERQCNVGFQLILLGVRAQIAEDFILPARVADLRHYSDPEWIDKLKTCSGHVSQSAPMRRHGRFGGATSYYARGVCGIHGGPETCGVAPGCS